MSSKSYCASQNSTKLNDDIPKYFLLGELKIISILLNLFPDRCTGVKAHYADTTK